MLLLLRRLTAGHHSDGNNNDNNEYNSGHEDDDDDAHYMLLSLPTEDIERQSLLAHTRNKYSSSHRMSYYLLLPTHTLML